MKKLLSTLGTIGISIAPVMGVVACGGEENQPITPPGEKVYDLSNLNTSGEMTVGVPSGIGENKLTFNAAVAKSSNSFKIWDASKATDATQYDSFGYYPDEITGDTYTNYNTGWMLSDDTSGAEAIIKEMTLEVIQDYQFTDNSGLSSTPFQSATSEDINVDWNYDNAEGDYTEVITASGTNPNITGEYSFEIHNYRQIELGWAGNDCSTGNLSIQGWNGENTTDTERLNSVYEALDKWFTQDFDVENEANTSFFNKTNLNYYAQSFDDNDTVGHSIYKTNGDQMEKVMLTPTWEDGTVDNNALIKYPEDINDIEVVGNEIHVTISVNEDVNRDVHIMAADGYAHDGFENQCTLIIGLTEIGLTE